VKGKGYLITFNHIGGVMASMLALSVVDHGSSHGQVKQKTVKLAFVASTLSIQKKVPLKYLS
jgi:hypothetical protein